VPWSYDNYNPVSPRTLSELDLLDLIIYEHEPRLEGQLEPSVATILTTYAIPCIQALRSAPHDPEPVMDPALIEEERRVLTLFASGNEKAIRVDGSMKATLMPDGTFTYGSRKGLSSFQLLHIYTMDFEPTVGEEDWMTSVSALNYLYLEGDRDYFSLGARLKRGNLPMPTEPLVVKKPCDLPPLVALAKVEPFVIKKPRALPKIKPLVPAKPESDPSLSAILKSLEERETALKATKEALVTKERERLTAIHEAKQRIAALEADVARLEKVLL